MARAVKSFSYDTVDDRDLGVKIDALAHGELSAIVRVALRLYWATESRSATVDDVYQIVRRIERKLEQGVIVSSTGATTEAADPGADVAGTEDAASNLDAWAV